MAHLRKTTSLESLLIPTATQESMLTSTKNQAFNIRKFTTNDRRLSIIPTGHRPNINQAKDRREKPDEEDKIESTQLKQSYNQRCNFDAQRTNQIDPDKINSSNESLDTIQDVDGVESEADFDSFILQHFAPFSGSQNVNDWLDETEEKFDHYKISRQLRFEGISLLVKSNAKRLYMKHRNDIHSFDDFYNFLLLQFPVTPSFLNTKSFHQQKGTIQDNSNIVNSQNSSSATHKNVGGNFGAPKFVGVPPAKKSTTTISDPSINIFDQTTNDLRKAIVADLIKNPKVFKGAKDDVQKWIEDIEHLLDIAQIPETSRLNLISYSLRGDALQWYKINKDIFITWPIFIQEIKRAFTSSFHTELAFKKLEAYTQGEHQSIRNFYNEVLKLCKETDPTMSEATKLKNLLNKTKPSIQLEVRKKKPISTTEFLEYAKDVEELFQLSNINLDTNKIQNSNTTTQTSLLSRANTTASNDQYPNNSVSTKFTSNRSRNFYTNDSNYNNRFQNQNNRSSYQPSSSTTPSFQNQPRNTTSRFPNNRNNDSLNRNDTNRFQSQTNQTRPSNNTQTSARTANTIFPQDSSNDIDLEPESPTSIYCTQCNVYGHDLSSCQNF